MQLVAYGAQDVYLTGNPQITFFKVVYRRHTNFSMEAMEQSMTGTPNYGNRVTCRIARNGDLLSSCYVQATLKDASTDKGYRIYNPRPGFNLLQSVELRIGGQKIDKQTGRWMDVWSELSSSYDKSLQLNGLVGSRVQRATATTGTNSSASSSGLAGHSSEDTQRVNVPLQFSFCRNPGLAIPLIALQYHEVELVIEFEKSTNMSRVADANSTANTSLSLEDVSLWADYIFLDTEERKNFAQNSHEYLIETVQENTETVSAGTTETIKLTFNHPVKELVWVYSNSNTSFGNYTDNKTKNSYDGLAGSNPCEEATIRLNGQDRISTRSGEHFNNVQPYQHHSGNPVVGINCYSFAVQPEDHQPSGTCNFSRIDNAELAIKTVALTDTTKTQLNVFAHSYNVLRVASGMGGLAYSN
jgi:hypothetical protein